MTGIIDRLDEIEMTVMDELKDFQKATVKRIDYLYRNGQNRVLVSDEVGLGKTLVARGAIAKFLKLRKDEGDDLVKVLYICSNATIAEQNLDKLRIVNEIKPQSTNTSRLSMQHLNIFNEENDEDILSKYIQLIPLTPETSFKVSNSQGTVDERALMFAILKRIPEFKRYRRNLERIFRFGVKYWDWPCYWYEKQVIECDEKSNGEYIGYMTSEIAKKLKENGLWESFGQIVRKRSFDKKEVKPYIVKLRLLFADISLNKLDPDLIIMDEFQRFKYLLNSDVNSEMDKLTNKFFNSDDVRILMLSATPYKMYSTLDEIDEEQIDAHYSEFFDVIDFLNKTEEEKQEFRDIWNNYSIKLKEFNMDKTSFILAKANAEDAMFKIISRTERITERQLGDMIDGSDAKNQLKVIKEDITSYMEIQQLLDEIGLNINVPMDYVKSTPYLMSFMKNYQLKRKIERQLENNPDDFDKLRKPTLWLDKRKINDYRRISPNNARLDNLMEHVLKDNAPNLLWAPPSLPYYELGGAFKDSEGFSKTLIFSSWEMVPRMISSLVSYEVERQTIGTLKRDVKYFAGRRRYPSPRMRFSLKDDEPTQMSLFTLIYPSMFLINAYNPIECLGLSLNEIESKVRSKIEAGLARLPCEDTARDDLRWYHLAPMLLDPRSYVESWFGQSDKFVDSGKGFSTHFNELFNQYFNSDFKLGKKPDDLADVLCDMALAAPAICAYRSYEQELAENLSMDEFIYSTTQIGRKFIDLMNLPESIAVIDLNSTSNSEDAYWKNVLKYSKDGNLQAVFDEYVHLLSNGLDKNNKDRILIINDRFLTSIEFRTTSYDIDTLDTFKARMDGEEYDNVSLRTHFAVSFTKGRSNDKDTNRKKSVRDAFNSPFRPFVLASTSIGQEGLDFHNYCRRIVHWNLPSNPIDLEQREGRINRFECLAIRQNVAKRYAFDFKNNIWDEIFKKASENEKIGGCSDLIPYWGLMGKDMVKIERIVPIYPFSRDEIRYDRLIKILSLYRLTLGQARQEELLDAIISKLNVDDDEINDLFINLSPFYKEKEISNNLFNLTTNNAKHPSIKIKTDLSHYWYKLIEKGDFNNKLIKWDSNIYWLPISGVILDLARIEMMIHEGYLEVKLFHPNIEHKDSLYRFLYKQKNEIEKELGFKLYWKNQKSSKISIFVPIDINDENLWNDAINWHLYFAKRFDGVFSPKVRRYYDKNTLKLNNMIRTQYWVKLRERLCKTDLNGFDVPHSHPFYRLVLDDVSFSECRLELHAYTHINEIKTSIIIEKSLSQLYDYLIEDKSSIEKEIGFELEWVKNKGRCHIRTTYEIDIKNRDNWEKAIEWHLNTVKIFKNVFNRKMKESFH